MGIKVREKVKDSGEWWVFVNHRGRRTAKKVGSREAAEAAATIIEEKIGTEGFELRSKAETITLRQFAKSWMSGHVEKNLKPASARSYRGNLDNPILPEFGSYPIDQSSARCLPLWGKPSRTD